MRPDKDSENQLLSDADVVNRMLKSLDVDFDYYYGAYDLSNVDKLVDLLERLGKEGLKWRSTMNRGIDIELPDSSYVVIHY